MLESSRAQRWKLNLLWGGGPAEAQMQLLGWEPQRITPGLWNLITHTSKLRGGKTCFGIHSTSECVLCASKFEKVLLTGVANSKTSANSKQTINPWTLCEITYCRIWICVYAVQAFQALFTTDTLIRATAGDQRWAEDKSPDFIAGSGSLEDHTPAQGHHLKGARLQLSA